jgi:lycopene cyclase domain-containing protein
MWGSVLPSIIIIGTIFIIGDIFFTKSGIWGFNPAYHSKLILIGLPVEEWLFFLFIPYASIFLHFVIAYYFPHFLPGNSLVRIISLFLIVILSLVIVYNCEKTYTLVVCSMIIFSLALALFNTTQVLNRFFISFLIILIPFFIINALLTGTLIKEEVVWYNNTDISGILLLTVPIEDLGYAFSLILLNLLLITFFQKVLGKRNDIKQV